VATSAGAVAWCAHKYLVAITDVAQADDFPWFKIALSEIGVKEYSGAADNPRVVEYLSSTNLGAKERRNDETYWCSAFVNWCIEKAGYAGTDSAWARSWQNWGRSIDEPVRGCIVVLKRPCDKSDTKKACGHVAFFISRTEKKVRLLGGNQSSAVQEQNYPVSDVLSYRLPG
jgi:uncharacterized protein (TIGR02594 family)